MIKIIKRRKFYSLSSLLIEILVLSSLSHYRIMAMNPVVKCSQSSPRYQKILS